MLLLIIFVTCVLITMSLIALTNVLSLPRLMPNKSKETSFVSILIPARNEAAVIEKTLSHLLKQDYASYEVILLDDNSTDGTQQIVKKIADSQTKLEIVSGKPLPSGWMGKNWACHQLSQHAKGDILIFTDADVIWQPNALGTIVHQMEQHQADLFTVWPTQETHTSGERLTVPLMAMVIIAYLPVLLTHHSPFSIDAAANGQCMAWRRKAYKQVGRHEIVAGNVLEDVTLARLAKSKGLKVRMADGNRLVGCRMYTDWSSVRDGYAKNILAGYGNSVTMLLAATVFHLLVFVAPFIWLFIPEYTIWSLALIIIGISLRMLSAAFTHQRLLDALLLPLSVLLMTRIAFQAIWWHYTGTTRWKGRNIASKRSMNHG